MTVKEFFKSNVFKCITVLLCVLLVSGIFLTICYGFMEVPEGERLQRAVTKIYGDMEISIYGRDEDGNETVIDSTVSKPRGLLDNPVTIGAAEVKQAYKVTYTEDGKEVLNYLVSSTGKRGYAGGNITCWVALNIENGAVSSIYKVVISQNNSQTLMADINGSSILQEIYDGYEAGIQYVPTKPTPEQEGEYIVSGATMSSTAVCNAVNGALNYVGGLLGGNG